MSSLINTSHQFFRSSRKRKCDKTDWVVYNKNFEMSSLINPPFSNPIRATKVNRGVKFLSQAQKHAD
jgi:hypothetical protein